MGTLAINGTCVTCSLASRNMKSHEEGQRRTRQKALNRKQQHEHDKDHREEQSSEEEQSLCSREAAKKSIKYFLQNSSLHGLKYIAEERITIPERCV